MENRRVSADRAARKGGGTIEPLRLRTAANIPLVFGILPEGVRTRLSHRAGFRLILFAAALLFLPFSAAAQQTVHFPTHDGGLIYADLYGTGDRAVILAHGGRFNKESWAKQAKILTEAGFRVLAIDLRGYGQSRGGSQQHPHEDLGRFDVLGAISYLRNTGAKTVSVVGASMGGDYAAEAAQAEPNAIDRIVLLASGAYDPLTKMKGPKLFIVARDDANEEGLRLPKIRAQYEKALNPKQLIVVDGSAHAQFLFDTNQGDRVMSEILRFLSAR